MLSAFEKACLQWISQGRSVPDISLSAGRPIAEIESCLARACASLGVRTPEDAVEKATLPESKAWRGTKRPNPIDVEVGVRIRFHRRQLGLSQGKLAEALGITFQQIQKYEKGTNRVGASRLQNIANALGVPVTVFFDVNRGPANGLETDTHLLAGRDLTAFLQTAEAKELNVAFLKITSPAIRKRVLALVKAIDSYPDETSEGVIGVSTQEVTLA